MRKSTLRVTDDILVFIKKLIKKTPAIILLAKPCRAQSARQK